MPKTNKTSVIDELLSQFRKVLDQRERKEIVEQIGKRVSRADAHKALMKLLAEEPVEAPNQGYNGMVAGAISPDFWRDTAYRLLFNGLCTGKEAFSFVRQMAVDSPGPGHRIEALGRLSASFAKHPETLGLLMACADNDSSSYAKSAALSGIVTNHADNPDARVYLMRAAQSPDALSPQSGAIVALAEHHAEHPDTRPLLEDLATRGLSRRRSTGMSKSMRARDIDQAASTAISVLAAAYPNDENLFELTLRRAKLAQDTSEVGSTYFTLMKVYHERPETVSLLSDRARNATHSLVRQTAIDALAKYPTSDPGVLPLLIERARDDEDRWPRCAAVRALAILYAHDAGAEARVIDRAASDSSAIVRQSAVKMLGQHFSHSAQAMKRLIKSVNKDRSAEVRELAGDALMVGFGDDLTARRALRRAGYRNPEERVLDTARNLLKAFIKGR